MKGYVTENEWNNHMQTRKNNFSQQNTNMEHKQISRLSKFQYNLINRMSER